MKNTSNIKVLLNLDRARNASRCILRGIAKYAHLHGPWQFDTRPPFYRDSHRYQPKIICRTPTEDINGIITYIDSKAQINTLKKIQKPAVVIPMLEQIEDYPNILGDWDKTGRFAAEHFLERGLRHFAFCGLDPFIWAKERGQAFCNYLKKAGYQVNLYTPPKQHKLPSWEKELPCMVRWLQSLPKPVGLLAWNDERGENIIEACLTADITVPEEVAVLGIDNDDLICDLLDIPLSSMAMNFEQAGYQAAELLDKLMSGKKFTGQHIIVKPTHIIARKSTDILTTDDPDLAQALRFISDNASKIIQVDDVVGNVFTSRRTLQKKFHKYLGRSIHAEITRVRIEKAARMLEETNLTASQIAQALKYSDVSDFYRSFRKTKGLTPLDYRSQFGRK